MSEVKDLPEDWAEQKYMYDLEQLTDQFLRAGGSPKVGASILARTMSDVMSVAVMQEIQTELAPGLKWLVDQVRELKGEPEDVPTEQHDEGETPDSRGSEDGQDSGAAVGGRDAGEGG